MGKKRKTTAEQKKVKAWLAESAEGFLQRAGVGQDQRVLDFGCHSGNYTLPVARIVGKRGMVYAIDKDKQMLRELRRTAKRNGLSNIEFVHMAGDGKLPLRRGLVDMVFLYDVLHRGYLPEAAQRKQVLENIYRVLKPGGLLSFYPTHVKKYGLTVEKLLREVRKVRFKLRGEARRRLVHDGKLVRGRIFTFRS